MNEYTINLQTLPRELHAFSMIACCIENTFATLNSTKTERVIAKSDTLV